MPKLKSAAPRYRHHKASGRAVVTLNSHGHHLGPYGSDTSRAAYDRLVAEWLVSGRNLAVTEDPTVSEMLVRYLEFARGHYRTNGKPTHEIVNIKSAMRPLKRLYGPTLVRDFEPLALKAIQSDFVSAGLARPTINARISAIRRIFAWAVSEELAPPSWAHALSTARGLLQGRTTAR